MEAVHDRTRSTPSTGERPVVTFPRVRPETADVPISIVVPARDEADRLRATLPGLLAAASSLGAELIVVDDGSTDATASIVADGINGNNRAELIVLERHLGKGAAVRTGVARARGAAICFMDADLATDLIDLPLLVAGLDDAHLVIGSRATPGSVVTGAGPVRVAMGRSFNRLARSATGLTWRDTQCGFKAFRAPVAKLLFDLSSEDGFTFDLEILALADRIGYRVAEVPVHWHAVRGSHIGARDPLSMAMSTLRIGTRTRSGRVLSSLRAWRRNGRPAGELVEELRIHLDGSPSVVRYGAGAIALLPFVAPETSHELAVELRTHRPDLVIEPTLVTAGLLFDSAGDELRAALVGA
jgi:hypothetical protein